MAETVTSTMIAKWIVLCVWAMIGGITHALSQRKNGTVKTLVDGIILTIISGFAGAMWGLLAMKFYPNDIILLAFASGMGGFMSLEGLAVLADKYFTRKKNE